MWKLDKVKQGFLKQDLYRTLKKISEFVRYEGAIGVDDDDGMTATMGRGRCDAAGASNLPKALPKSNPFVNKKAKRTIVEKVESMVLGTPFYENDIEARALLDRIRDRALEDQASSVLRRDEARINRMLQEGSSTDALLASLFEEDPFEGDPLRDKIARAGFTKVPVTVAFAYKNELDMSVD